MLQQRIPHNTCSFVIQQKSTQSSSLSGHYVMEGPENNELPLSLMKTTILLTGYFLQAFHMCLGSPKVGIKHGGRRFWLETLFNT